MGNGGVFTGSVATVTGFATIDGRLQVRDGDTIQVVYHGTTPPVTLSAVAVADLAAPQIYNVLTWNRFGRTFIAWDTDERADGVVRYGTSPQSLTMAVTNSFYRDYQEVDLMDLTPGVTYYYLIEARDQAGNMAVDDNNGQLYTFVPQPAATALVVDAYYNDLFAVPPLSGYTVALDQAGISYETWEVEFEGTPTAADLRPFPLVIWRVPEFGLETTLPAGARQAITNYLASGGSLLMASMELTSRLDEGSAGWFRSNVLHVAEYNPDVFLPVMTGAPNEPISSGLSVDMDYTVYEDEIKEYMSITADASDTITAGPGAVPIFFNDVNPVGVRYPQTGVDVPGRVIFLSTALDAIPLSGTAPNTRAHILGNMISFLVPGINGIGTISMDRSQYTLPSVIRIEVADSDLKGQGQVTVQIFSDTEPGGQQVRLYETGRKGVFQGSINLVSAENAPAADRLRAAAGDTIWAEYNDASLGNTNRISAVVDMVPCVITGVEAFPDYVDGWVMWETSEPADSLVQFGKTRMLDRVAYWPEFTFSHELLLTGLEPDQTYYYRVVSRDLAGNTTIDDNSTNLYTFRTQHPTYPPWQDDLEQGGDQWTVYTGEDSDGLGWEWGVPANGVETSAHSPANAWGSSLNGEAVTWMQTFLISPPIYITGGNNATLNFWHSYDFTERDMGDLSEGGAVLILTNQYSDYIVLGQFGMDEYSYGWEEANFDLTPYVGQVVYLVWYYELLTFPMENVANRPGWLVDDISVSVANVIPGTLMVTNNIWQASFDVSGPIKRSSRGTSLVITNAPPGEYTISYLDVPFYLKPPADTKVLASSGAISFTGNYQMTDANNNGISDAWETQYFGSVSPNRTQATDSDGDGACDYAEFLAGTDPRVSNSVFAVSRLLPLGNGTVRLEWVSAKNRAYRVEASRDLRTWTAVSDWVHALSTTSYYILPQPGPDDPRLYRVLLQP